MGAGTAVFHDRRIALDGFAAMGRGHFPIHSDEGLATRLGLKIGIVFSAEYQLEYGTEVLQVHTDAVSPGERVLVVDDLVATGGTAMAAISLLAQLKATVLGVACVIDLPELGGTARLASHSLPTRHLISFEGH